MVKYAPDNQIVIWFSSGIFLHTKYIQSLEEMYSDDARQNIELQNEALNPFGLVPPLQ